MESALIKGFIQKEIMNGNGGEKLENGDNLIEKTIIDSLGIVKLIGYLEKTFRIAVRDDELVPENFETVEAIASFVRRKQDISAARKKTDVYYGQPGV